MNFFTSLAESKVDRETGVISGVSVISVGEAKGHGMFVDGTTLEQVKLSAEQHEDGVKVKTDHWSGFNGIVGVIKNFQIDGDKLRGDLHLLENHEAREKVLEMAEKMPSQFGISISFSGEAETQEVEAEGVTREVKFARCESLEACDLVDSPAANASGLFSNAESRDQFSKTLTDLSAQNVTLMAKVEELSTKLSNEEGAHQLTKGALAQADAAYEAEMQWRQRLEKFQALSPATVVPAVESADLNNEDTDESKLAKYQALTGRERTAFFRDHKEALTRAAKSAHA
jgi:hypothetical protein